MSGVLGILLIVVLVGLVWGLISPHHLAKTTKVNKPITRKHTGLFFGLLIVVLFIALGATSPQQSPHSQQKVNLTAKSSNTSHPTTTVTTKQVNTTQSIPYKITDQNDSNLSKGQTSIAQTGKNGEETLTWSVTYTNGKQTYKTLTKTTVTTQPVNEIVDVGTYVAPQPSPTTESAPTPNSGSSCYPLSDEGTCYEPGEYCRDDDHGMSGLAGDGESITCEDNDGWRWEP